MGKYYGLIILTKEIAEYQPDWKEQEANAIECYNLAIDEDDDPRNINILESEGHCEYMDQQSNHLK